MSNFTNTISVLGDDAVVDSIISRSITEFSDDVITSLKAYAFRGCKQLTRVDLPKLASQLPDNAFADCTALTEVNLPLLQSMRFSGFDNCTALTSIKLPSITSMSSYCFNGCTALRSVDFTALSQISGAQTFYRDTNLSAVVLRKTDGVVTLGYTSSFADTPIESGTGYIYVPRALVDTYKAATNWSTYAAQFRALEDYTVDGTVTGELDTNYLGDTIVEDGLWFNLDLRGRTADNGDGGDHSLVDSVNGYECTVHNVAFDGENDGFVENGLKLKPITDFSSAAGFNQYVARTYATVELFNAKEFYGGDIPTDNTQEFEVTVEVTGNVWGNANVSGEKGCVVFAGQEPMPSMQFTADKTWNDSDYFCKSDGSTDYLIRYHLGCVNIDGTLIGHKNVFDYSQDHTYTITKSKDGKITTYIDGMRFLTSTGAPETAAEDFSHWLARNGQYKSYLGSASNGSFTTAPKIYSHVRVYKRALTEREVKNNYRFDVSKRSVSN